MSKTENRSPSIPATEFVTTYLDMFEKHTYSEIASKLGSTKNTVVMRVQSINKAWKDMGINKKLPSPKRESRKSQNRVDWAALASLIPDVTVKSDTKTTSDI